MRERSARIQNITRFRATATQARARAGRHRKSAPFQFHDAERGGEPIALGQEIVGFKLVYTFKHRKTKKLIPGNLYLQGETHGFEKT